MHIFAVILVFVPLSVEGVTVGEIQAIIRQELQQEVKQKDLQHERDLAQLNQQLAQLSHELDEQRVLISGLQVQFTF